MKSLKFLLAGIAIISLGLLAFSTVKTDTLGEENSGSVLDSYWYNGTAEVSSYSLDQNRYRDNHPGEMILIQVTEDFLTDKQVKNDYYQNKNSVPILKTNHIKKFLTGIYDYSVMNSMFTSVDKGYGIQTLKTSFSSQDWCGHSYLQSNFRNGSYHFSGHSYFENEADQEFALKDAVLEDEIWNLIRINPEKLPMGSIAIIPSAEYQRFSHSTFKTMKANATLSDYLGRDMQGERVREYKLKFYSNSREVSFYFESAAPYKIVGWKEVRNNPNTGKPMISTARIKKSILVDYWTKNSLNDRELRKKLELDM